MAWVMIMQCHWRDQLWELHAIYKLYRINLSTPTCFPNSSEAKYSSSLSYDLSRCRTQDSSVCFPWEEQSQNLPNLPWHFHSMWTPWILCNMETGNDDSFTTKCYIGVNTIASTRMAGYDVNKRVLKHCELHEHSKHHEHIGSCEHCERLVTHTQANLVPLWGQVRRRW